MFVGRQRELDTLFTLLTQVADSPDRKPGRAVLVRGRRRVGKSRLVEEFIDRAEVPSFYFAAARQEVPVELASFMHALSESSLPGAVDLADARPGSWLATLRLMVAALPSDNRPAVVVIDELPYVIEKDPDFEGVLQQIFDRELSRRRVLLICIGSDLAMMEMLDEYGRPFHQRARAMVVPPLTPAEVASMLGLAAADAFDAFLVTGGLPLVCEEWPPGASAAEYLRLALADPTSALIVSGERSLAAEFPVEAQARTVLEAIGSGERTFTGIQRASGLSTPTALNRGLRLLQDKRIVAADIPLSTKNGASDKRYRVADPYLRFWLEFLARGLPEVERGRGDRVLARIQRSWTSWRGRAVEPVLREALDRLSPPESADTDGTPGVVGSYWTRTNDVEVDIVIGDRAPLARRLIAVGSIKWLENAPFDDRHLHELIVHRSRVPGATSETPLVAVSRSGCTAPGITCFGPEELLGAY